MLSFQVGPAAAGKRLDHFLQNSLQGQSRARLQSWIKQGRVLVDGQPSRASQILKAGQQVEVSPGELPPLRAEPEDLPVQILY
jgi:23S rRNA-/tRNA-specific pseudouridylate synthase